MISRPLPNLGTHPIIDLRVARVGARAFGGDDQEKASLALFIAEDVGFLTLIQSRDGPAWYRLSRRFETKPSSIMSQAALNRAGAISPCSKGAWWMPSARRANSRARLFFRRCRGSFGRSSPSHLSSLPDESVLTGIERRARAQCRPCHRWTLPV